MLCTNSGFRRASRRVFCLLTAVSCVWLAADRAVADTVTLKDGSTLNGEVVSLFGEKLTFKTGYAGTITIDVSQIKSLTTSDAVSVSLDSGEQLVGKVSPGVDGKVNVSSSALGSTSVGMDKVTAMWGKDGVNPSIEAAQQAAAAKAAAAESAHQDEVARIKAEHEQAMKDINAKWEQRSNPWSSKLSFGIDGKTGNTERFAFRGGFEVNRNTDIDRLKIYARGTLAEENGNRSEAEAMGGVSLEVDMTERLFVYAKTDLEYDEFENLDLRSTTAAGVGYFFIREDDMFWKGRAGLGYQYESYVGGRNEDSIILELGYDFQKQIEPWLLFDHSLTLLPTLDDFGDYRLEIDTAAEIPLGNKDDWKLRIGMRNDYDAMPAANVDRLDTTYYANMVLEFKD